MKFSSRKLFPRMKFVSTALLIGAFSLSSIAQNNQERYIAVLANQADDSRPSARAIERSHTVNIGAVYNHALRGFAFGGNARAAQAIAQNSDVAYVVPDTLCFAIQQTIPTGISRTQVGGAIPINGQSDDLVSDVRVAVLDTGLDIDHPDLNVIGGIHFFIKGRFKIASNNNYDDDHWHGTHVGGTIGAIDNGFGVVGVAPGVELYGVKVLDQNGSGYTSAIIAGIDHVVALNADGNTGNDIHVANMSLGGGYNQALNEAVSNAAEAGIVFVVAAGNENSNASGHSPASEPDAITVSALADSDGIPEGFGAVTSYGLDDWFATFSNYGTIVDICAPGVDILSTYPGGQYASASGTSMASPHVAGAAALFIANDPDPYGGNSGLAAVNAVRQVLLDSAWNIGDDEYILGGDGDGAAEPLMNVGALSSHFGPINSAPIVSITNPADGNSFSNSELITFEGTASDEDGDLSAGLTWTSNLETGSIGTGAAFSAVLSDGTHLITATAIDSEFVAGSANIIITVGTPNSAPDVTIISPADGAIFSSGESITFTGTASDEDGDLSADLLWTSNLDNSIGSGATFSAVLSDGTHEITASVMDTGAAEGESSITVIVQPAGGSISVSGIDYSTSGGRSGDKHLAVLVSVVSGGSPVSGATVSAAITNSNQGTSSGTGTTGSAGTVLFEWKNAPAGDYVTEVTGVIATGLTWDEVTPDNSFNK